MPTTRMTPLGRVLRRGASGYGIAVILVFLITMVTLGVSLQMLSGVSQPILMRISRNKNTAEDVARSAFSAVRADVLSRLDASTVVDTSYSYSGEIRPPNDPNNPAGADSQIGTYTATIPYARGNTFLLKVTANVGGVQAVKTEVLQARKITVASFDCDAIETQIKAGSIASISDSNLIAYAQNGCMIKTASPSLLAVSPVTVNAGTGTNCTGGSASISGSGTLNRGSLSGGCVFNANSSYSVVRFGSISNATLNSPYAGTRALHATTLGYATVDASTISGTYTMAFTSAADSTVRGTQGNDVISFTSDVDATSIYGTGGTDEFIIQGTFWDGVLTGGTSNTFRLSNVGTEAEIDGGSGADTISVLTDLISGAISGNDGDDTIMVGGNINIGCSSDGIYGGNGNDNIYLNNVFSRCAAIDGGSGNDTIFFNLNFAILPK